MSNGLLPIGMFSRAACVSIKQLRAYHEIGLLVPAHVDPDTGYRRYSDDQLADAAVIVRLRQLDLPLEVVRRVLVARDPEHTAAILAEHQRRMQSRLSETERIVAELQSGVAPATHTPVHLISEKPALTLRVTGAVTVEDMGPWIGRAYELLGEVLQTSGAIPAGPPGALYPPEISDEGAQEIEVHVVIADPAPLLPPDAHVRGVSIGELPAVECAVLVHAGSYETIGETYRTLGAWVARHADHAGAAVRERYLVGPQDVEAPQGYRTEICWPIIPGSGPAEPRPRTEQ